MILQVTRLLLWYRQLLSDTNWAVWQTPILEASLVSIQELMLLQRLVLEVLLLMQMI